MSIKHSKKIFIDFGNSYVKYYLVELNSESITLLAEHSYSSRNLESKILNGLDFLYKKHYLSTKSDVIFYSNVVSKVDLIVSKKSKFKFININRFKKHIKAANSQLALDELGSDLLSMYFAIICKSLSPAIVCGFGTANTYFYINKSLELEGVIITPGFNIKTNSLLQHTSLLSRIYDKDKDVAFSLFGADTTSAIKNGVLLEASSLIKHLNEEIKVRDNISNLNIVLTGGYAAVVSKNLNINHQVIDYLVILGMIYLYKTYYEKN